MHNWALAGTTFLASSVEFVEAATIVLAVGYAQGWRGAIAGMIWATLALVAIVALFGRLILAVGSLQRIELVVGPFLILFGISWLRKAVWRWTGRKALRDEQALYDRNVTMLRADRENRLGFAVAFQGVLVEGLEVAVIVVTFGAAGAGALLWSFNGAAAALVLVVIASVALRKPFARVPENALKAVVGVMLLSLGTFWLGEGLRIDWWAGDATLFVLAGVYVVATAAIVGAGRLRMRRPA